MEENGQALVNDREGLVRKALETAQACEDCGDVYGADMWLEEAIGLIDA